MFLNTQHSWGIVVAKFLKTKHLSNSGVYGFKILFFIDWDKRFEVYACINPEILLFRTLKTTDSDFTSA